MRVNPPPTTNAMTYENNPWSSLWQEKGQSLVFSKGAKRRPYELFHRFSRVLSGNHAGGDVLSEVGDSPHLHKCGMEPVRRFVSRSSDDVLVVGPKVNCVRLTCASSEGVMRGVTCGCGGSRPCVEAWWLDPRLLCLLSVSASLLTHSPAHGELLPNSTRRVRRSSDSSGPFETLTQKRKPAAGASATGRDS